MSYLIPPQIAAKSISLGKAKAARRAGPLLALAFLAGMFIALAAAGANIASATIANPSVAKLVGACIFPVGLVMTLIAGSELFTGNTLLSIPWLEKEISTKVLLHNWLLVYAGNFLGALFVVLMMDLGGHFGFLSGAVAVQTIKVAVAKSSLGFVQAVALGVGCNFLVCIGVWISYAADSVGGKVAGLYMPVMLFVLAGFEHSVANMYYIPAGLAAAGQSGFAAQALAAGIDLGRLSLGNFLLGNLLPVTLGNIIGGALLVGGFYWYAYLRK